MIRAECGEDLIVRMIDGEDVGKGLREIACEAAWIQGGVGMVRNARLAYWNGSAYEEHVVDEPCELLSMQGNIGRDENETPVVHCHVALARRDGTVVGGHLIAATAHNTVEAAFRSLPNVRLVRKPEPSGLVGLYPTVR